MSKKNIGIKNVIILFICIVAPLIIGILSSYLSGNIGSKYEILSLPPLSPPGWLFGVVWPILYVLMGISIFLIVRSSYKEKSIAINLFILQLILNFIWSPIFFGIGNLWLAFVIVIILDIVVLLCIIKFKKINTVASALITPYFLWLLFATYLNISVAMIN